MTIREYWDALIAAVTIDEMDEIMEHETEIYELSQTDFDAFCEWADREGIDLTACDPDSDISVLILWSWDMCGD